MAEEVVLTEKESLFSLDGKVVVVTGGSRGLGREMCLSFAEHGAHVVVASRKGEACEALAVEITERTGRRAVGLALHVARWEQCEPFVDRVIDEFGAIDVLVNNAGSSPLYPSLREVNEKLFDSVVGLNMKGPFRLAVLVGDHMVETGRGGSIVNVSSVAAVQPSKNEVPYGMAKAGLNNLTLALARAYGPTVRVNCIMAGPFLTDVAAAWDMEEFNKSAVQRIPLARGGEPREVVGTALYLASDASSFTTGAIIKVDGGIAWSPG
ncbi:SDR family NAD(P)-dependent oxidoreductase [Candidatus Poriferisocius sp.]|uniref:SDR family NAD(P)-dependent oxidoreductase n=1 Tax=Candidatus Poriferisocius sp. TaxID=3101276 RepID=UPI003B5B0198